MTLMEAIQNRHAVRAYEEKEIAQDVVLELKKEIDLCNEEASSAIQLITNDDEVFKGLMAHYGGFRGVRNYIALVGNKSDDLEEKMGYYGERLVLKAQQLGLNTCWVAVTYKKKNCKAVIGEDQELVCVIALGYGKTQGTLHKSKPMEKLCRAEGSLPDWFRKGMEAAMLAPTALNKQDFLIILEGNEVRFQAVGGQYAKLDLGIAKYHFEVGADFAKGVVR